MLGCTTLWFIINYNTHFRWMPFSDIHISKSNVATYLRHVGYLNTSLLQIYCRVRQWKKFENRLFFNILFGVVMGKRVMSCFLTHGVVSCLQCSHHYDENYTVTKIATTYKYSVFRSAVFGGCLTTVKAISVACLAFIKHNIQNEISRNTTKQQNTRSNRMRRH